MDKTKLIGLAILGLAASILPVGAQNLLVNGNFNTGDFTGWSVGTGDSTESNIINTTLEYDSTPNAQMFGGDGAWSASLAQNVTIASDTQYQFGFVYNSLGTIPTGNFQVLIEYWDGGSYVNYDDVYNAISTSGSWQSYISPVFTTPVASIDHLSFSLNLANPGSAVQLDDVYLEVVPEPTSLALLGGGALTVLILRRRRAAGING